MSNKYQFRQRHLDEHLHKLDLSRREYHMLLCPTMRVNYDCDGEMNSDKEALCIKAMFKIRWWYGILHDSITWCTLDVIHFIVITYAKYTISSQSSQARWGNTETFCEYTVCAWWRHHMETFSAFLAYCAENSPVTGEFPVTRSSDIFYLRMNKRLCIQS